MVRMARIGAVALAILGIGCSGGSSFGGNPLEGTWTTGATVGTFSGTQSYDVNPDGTIVVSVTGTAGACTGSFSWTGYTWAATNASITFSGTATCTGALTCGAFSYDCSKTQSPLTAGSCTYTLSNNDNTLSLSDCSGTANGTFVRAN